MNGVTKLIRRGRFDKNGALVGIELSHAQHALVHLGKHWDIWKNSIDPDEVFEIALEALPVPLNICLWFNDHQDGAPVLPQL